MSKLVAENLSKYYRIYPSPAARLWELLLGRARYRQHWALTDVSFALEQGQALGVIGDNGAGKSTLLKLITGTLSPSKGRVQRHGRLTAILELGTGFHPEFSGRENLYYAGTVMGIGRDELKRRFDSIVEFAELAAVIDRPIKTYSTGMVVRLAFALVTSVDPDILIVDEALAVGDRQFQKKCLDRMVDIQRGGTTILFCSHSMHHVMQFCDQALWLEQGRVRELGSAGAVVDRYISASMAESALTTNSRQAENAGGGCHVHAVIPDCRRILQRGEKLALLIDFQVLRAGTYTFGVAIDRADTNMRLVAETTLENNVPPMPLTPGRYRYRLEVDTCALRQGRYISFAGLLDDTLLEIVDYDRLEFEIIDADPVKSPALIRAAVNWVGLVESG
ncbi:MAG: ABC transporter ATP-binding protein [Methylococcales bacterium]|nr:ABC transporter ATP-binding protein [Methylococcales bacterium]